MTNSGRPAAPETPPIEIAAAPGCRLAEGVLWHPGERRLYWIDIAPGRLFRFDPIQSTTESFVVGSAIGGFTFQRQGGLLLFLAHGRVISWRDGQATIVDELAGEGGGRFNDAIADPEGRVFCGTFFEDGSRRGNLYRLDPDGKVTRVLDGLACTNGMGFSPDLERFYHTDSGERTIYAFRYDRATGRIYDRKALVTIPPPAVPDGLTVDADGYVWSALWGGSAIVRYDPEGHPVRTIPLPIPRITSLSFGGNDFSELYISSAQSEPPAPCEGAIFHLRLDHGGRAEFYSFLHVR